MLILQKNIHVLSAKNHSRFIKKAMTRHDCDQCDQDFTNIGNLRRHVNSAHKKLNFNCAVADCGKVFHRKDVMKKHFTKCKSRAEMTLEFSREANTFSDIFYPFLQDRSTEDFLDCDVCDSRFSTKDSLKTHNLNSPVLFATVPLNTKVQ